MAFLVRNHGPGRKVAICFLEIACTVNIFALPATIDVKKKIYDLASQQNDQILGIIEVSGSCVKTLQVKPSTHLPIQSQ